MPVRTLTPDEKLMTDAHAQQWTKEQLAEDLRVMADEEYDLWVAANTLYFGDRNDPILWEKLRVAGNFPTMEKYQQSLAQFKVKSESGGGK